MSIFKIASVSLNLVGQDWGGNTAEIKKAIDQAVENGVNILAFSELTLPTPAMGDYVKYEDNNTTYHLLNEIARYAHKLDSGLVLSIGHTWYQADKELPSSDESPRQQDPRFNRTDKYCIAQSFIQGGNIIAMSAKMHLDDHYESRSFRPVSVEEKTTSLPDFKVVPFGDICISVKVNDETITLSHVIGDKVLASSVLCQTVEARKAQIILNPTASLPVSLKKIQLKKSKILENLTSTHCKVFVSTNPKGNQGGEYAYMGEQFVVATCKVTNVIPISDQFFYTSTMNIMEANLSHPEGELREKFSYPENSSNEVERELQHDALWLFDYLRKSGLKKIVQSFSNKFAAFYTTARIRAMVQLIGAEIFSIAMGCRVDFNGCLTEAEKIKQVMGELLVCVYCIDDTVSTEEQSWVEIFISRMGARLSKVDIQPEIAATNAFCFASEEGLLEAKARLKGMHALEAGNLIAGAVNIADTTLDQLVGVDSLVFGGDLHSGQLGINQDKWNADLIDQMRVIDPGFSWAAFGSYKLIQQQHRFIFKQMLYEYSAQDPRRKQNPIEVFEKCNIAPLFSGISTEKLYQKIKQCYLKWGEAQLDIHAAPLSSNYNSKAVNHDAALRTPNLNGFFHAELAELSLHCRGKFYLEKFRERVYVDNFFAEWLLQKESLEPFQVALESPILDNAMRYRHRKSVAAVEVSPVSVSEPVGTKILFKIASASCNQTTNDWVRNVENICAAIDGAVKESVDLLCLQELGLSGYGCDDNFLYADNGLTHNLLKIIAEYAASKNSNLIISVGHPWRLAQDVDPVKENKPFNVQSLIQGGQILSMSAKSYLFDYERGYEARYFSEWKSAFGVDGVININITSACTIPFGNPVTQIYHGQRALNLFVVSCEESWVGLESNAKYARDNSLAIKNRQYGVSVAINPNVSPPSPGKMESHRRLAVLGSMHSDVFVHTNALGTDSSAMVCLGTSMIAQGGVVIAEGSQILSVENMTYLSQVTRLKNVSVKPQRRAPHVRIQHIFNAHLKANNLGVNAKKTPWMKHLEITIDNIRRSGAPLESIKKHEDRLACEISVRNELLWMFDMMRKSCVHGFVQALSGGADSAYNAAKVRLMVQLVIKEKGLTWFLDQLNYPVDVKENILNIWSELKLDASACGENIDMLSGEVSDGVNVVMKYLLESYYLGTPNNSEDTLKAAKMLVEGGGVFAGIGGEFEACSIQSIVDEVLFSFTKIDVKTISEEQRKQVLKKLREFAGLRLDNIKILYNHVYKERIIDFSESVWPHGTEELLPEEKFFRKKAEEQRLLKGLEQVFLSELKEILGQDFALEGVILSSVNPDHGLMLENMQARIRQMLIFLLADVKRDKGVNGKEIKNFVKELMVNSNQSEGRNSYTTFGGDLHSGRMSFNSFIEKHAQIRQMNILYEHGLVGVSAPLTSLHYILNNSPSAELQGIDLESNAVAQTDEASLGRTYEEMEIIARHMFHAFSSANNSTRAKNPIEVFESLRQESLFLKLSIDQLGDKLLASYCYWKHAQHKLHCTPVSQTYGSDNIDHKFSFRTPCINAFHGPGQVQMILHCIAKMATVNGASFEGLALGLSLKECQKEALTNDVFCKTILIHLWTYEDVDKLGSKRVMKIRALYDRIVNKHEKIMSAFVSLNL